MGVGDGAAGRLQLRSWPSRTSATQSGMMYSPVSGSTSCSSASGSVHVVAGAAGLVDVAGGAGCLGAWQQADRPRVQVMESPLLHSQYAFWPRYDEEADATASTEAKAPMMGRSALFFTEVENRVGPPGEISGSFRNVRPLMVFEVRRYGAVVRRMRVFLCQDYLGGSL